MNIRNMLGVVYQTEKGMAIAANYGKLVVPDRSVKGLAVGDLVVITDVAYETNPGDDQRGVCFVRAHKLQRSEIASPQSWSPGELLDVTSENAGKFVRFESIDSDSPKIVVKQADMLLISINDRRIGMYPAGFTKKRFAMKGDWAEGEVSLPLLKKETYFSSARGVCIKSNFLKSCGRDWADFLLCSSEWDSGSDRKPFFPNWAFSPLEVDEADTETVKALMSG